MLKKGDTMTDVRQYIPPRARGKPSIGGASN